MEADALILSYRLTRPVGMALQIFQHLRSHFDQLDLADRYRRMGLEHLGGQHPALRRAYGPGEDAERVAKKLIQGAEDFERSVWSKLLARQALSSPGRQRRFL